MSRLPRTPLPPLISAERWLNEGTRSYSSHAVYSEAEERYRPNSTAGPFSLPAWSVSQEEVNLYQAGPSAEVARRFMPDNRALFCVHPQTLVTLTGDSFLDRLRREEPATRLQVVPSASTRTLYLEEEADEPKLALKVHFPMRISRYGRKMRDEVIEQAIRVSAELEEGSGAIVGDNPDFAFLREVLGVSYKEEGVSTGRGENWGYLVREMEPFPNLSGGHLLPGFALYGNSFLEPQQQPLLHQLLASRDPMALLLEEIMLPIVRHWVQTYRTFGFMLEPHAQNTLLEFEGDRVRRIVHRDLSVGIDMRIRHGLGLSSDHLNSYNRMEDGRFAAITYDMFMGHHFFDPLITCCRRRLPQLQEEEFHAPCRELFARLLPEYKEFLPETVHYFSEKRDEYGKPFYEDTGKRPVWRP